jgi:hypothetical protein
VDELTCKRMRTGFRSDIGLVLWRCLPH